MSPHVKVTFSSVAPVSPPVSCANATCAIAALAIAPASISAMASLILVPLIAPP